jgi:hypothetical protein
MQDKGFCLSLVLKYVRTSICIPNGIKQSYDAKFKLMVINYAKKTNNCNAGKMFSAVAANV